MATGDTGNYIFIDGNYLREAYRKVMREYFGNDGELDLRKLKKTAEATKVFYYDAVDETATDADARQAVLAKIQRYDGFHVRHGSVRGRRRRQKRVDVQLAVDMLGHAVRKNYWHATLVAGDLDFEPLVAELVLLGAHIHVFFERSSAAPELLDAADSVLDMNLPQFWDWSSNKYQQENPIPVREKNVGAPGGYQIVRRGRWRGRLVEHHQKSNGSVNVFWVANTQDHKSWRVTFAEVGKLERFFTSVYGAIAWG